MKKVVIVDDEAPARKLIKEYLSEYSDFIVLQECNNGVDAVKVINVLEPDLVFLDIQMPGLTGFEVLDRLAKLPKVIFSTAYDEYALRAFDVHAIDYLLKPYSQDRFDEAVKVVSATLGETTGQLAQLVNSLKKPQEYLENLLVQKKRKLIRIPTADIVWIKAEGNYAKVVTEDAAFLSSKGLKDIYEKLDPTSFVRVHRSALINLNYVDEISRYPSSFQVKMKNGDQVTVSRSYLDQVKKLIV